MTRTTSSDRLASLDALRGFDMFWIVGGRELVLALLLALGWQGAHDTAAHQLEHVAWSGFRAWDLVFPLFGLLDIDTMEGEQLDGIGSIVGEDRQGRSDAEYREAIRVRISLNVSSGEPETVIWLFKTLTDPTGAIDYFEDYPAGYVIYGDGDQFAELLAAMEAASPAGVYVGLLDFMLWEDGDDALWEDGDTIYVTYESSGR